MPQVIYSLLVTQICIREMQMTRHTTTIRIEWDLIKKAKDRGINISRVCEDSLREKLEVPDEIALNIDPEISRLQDELVKLMVERAGILMKKITSEKVSEILAEEAKAAPETEKIDPPQFHEPAGPGCYSHNPRARGSRSGRKR